MKMLPWLEAPLRQVLATQRGHAVLLAGPEGVGQFELALSLARAWLCETPGQERPCGDCASCKLVEAKTHPDLCVLIPPAWQEELGWAQADADADDAKESKASKAKPSKDIKVETLRRAIEFAQQTSSRGVGKVVLLHPAERLNAISANTLLKTLEEPPGKARFILSTTGPDALLPTIRSRCQHVALTLPEPALALQWLRDQGLDEPEVLLAAAGGQPLAALRLKEQGIDAAAWRGLPAQVGRGQLGAMSGWPVALMVATLQKICHDAMCITLGAAPRYFDAVAFKGIRSSMSALTQWSSELGRVARHDEHPWNAGLMTESLVSQARRALHSAE